MTDDRETPSAMTPASLQHGLIAQSLEASLTVRDLPESVAWYSDVLGFAVDREYRREGKLLAVSLLAVSLRAGTVQFLLGQDDGTISSPREG